MTAMARLTYPEPPTADQVDDYHGTRIADPYRPLEDSDAPASRAWIEAENRLTEGILGASAARADIRERLAALWTSRGPARPGDAGTAGSSSGTPGCRTRTCCGPPTHRTGRGPCSSTRTG